LSESFVTIALLFFKQNRNSQQKVSFDRTWLSNRKTYFLNILGIIYSKSLFRKEK